MTALTICSLPVLVPQGPANLAPVDGAIALTIGIALVWTATARRTFLLPYAAGALTMIMAGLVAGLAGRWPGLALSAVFQDVFLLLWAAAVTTVARTARAIEVLLRAWTTAAPLWGCAFVIATTSTALNPGPAGTRPGFTLGDSNGAGLYFALSLLLLLATRRPRRRILRCCGALVMVIALLYTGSLGATSGILLGLAIGLVLGVRSRRGVAAAIVVGCMLITGAASTVVLARQNDVAAAAHNSSNPLLRDSLGRLDQSSNERTVLRAETFQLWRSSNLIGNGPASTKNLLAADQAPYQKQAHNDWYAVLVERGVLGMLGLLLLTAELINRGWRLYQAGRLCRQQTQRILPRPGYLVGALACVLVFSTTHELLHDRTVWTIFAFVAAISIRDRDHAPDELEPEGTS